MAPYGCCLPAGQEPCAPDRRIRRAYEQQKQQFTKVSAELSRRNAKRSSIRDLKNIEAAIALRQGRCCASLERAVRLDLPDTRNTPCLCAQTVQGLWLTSIQMLKEALS